MGLPGVVVPQAGDDILAKVTELRASDPPSALELLDQAIEDITEQTEPELHATLLRRRAQIGRDLGLLEDALIDAEAYKSLAGSLDDPLAEASAARLIGTIRAEQGDMAAALEHFHQARELLEGTGNHSELANALFAIGIAHSFAEDYERSERYHRRALDKARRADDEALVTNILGNLAVVVAQTRGREAGLAVHEEALELARRQNNEPVIAYQLGSICDLQTQLGRLDEARATCPEAIERLEALGHRRILAWTRMAYGDLQHKLGNTKRARTLYSETLEAAEGSIPTVEIEVQERLSALHEAEGDHASALAYFKAMVEARETMRDEQARDRIEDLEVRYQVDQREREIQVLQLEKNLQEARLQRRDWMLFGVVSALVLSLLLAAVAWRGYRVKAKLEHTLAERNRELSESMETASRLAREDPLTGLLNRRAFADIARHEINRSRRTNSPLSLAMLDVDNFKRLNDEYGHQAGDDTLCQLAARLRSGLRELDVLARWGGEEFLCLFPNTSVSNARTICEHLRELVDEMTIDTSTRPLSVTITIGIAAVENDLQTAIDAADRMMYDGKKAGRNRVVVAD